MASQLNSDIQWKLLQAINVQDNNDHEITYSNIRPTEIMISYGELNEEQSYGGGTIILNSQVSKPCFMPVYLSDKLQSIVYMYYYHKDKRILVRRISGETALRFIVWYK